jgi:hypothetical protein
MNWLTYYCDPVRHLVCWPYSLPNLHRMAQELDIKRCWFHKDHYDIPKRRVSEIMAVAEIVSSRRIVQIIHRNDWRKHTWKCRLPCEKRK